MATNWQLNEEGCRALARPDCPRCHGKGIEVLSVLLDEKGQEQIEPCGCVVNRLRKIEGKK